MLWLESGEVFAVGRVAYSLFPPGDSRLIVPIEIAGIEAFAIVDTGAPYLVCNLELAERIGVSGFDNIGSAQLRTHRGQISGGLHRLPLKLIADEGVSVEIDATALVPDPDQLSWRYAPVFLGFVGCLERVRFAVDPREEKFYFGPCG